MASAVGGSGYGKKRREPSSLTSRQQEEVEAVCSRFFYPFAMLAEDEQKMLRDRGLINSDAEVLLMRPKHANYLKSGLEKLGAGYSSLDASRPWLVYWMIHPLSLMDAFPISYASRITDTLSRFQAASGGYGGGPSQLPHCAPTYASILALMIVGTPDAYESINRKALYQFFMRVKTPEGAFRMHDDGEVDTRATYTAICVAALLNMLTPELIFGVAEWLLKCQTYEGGFGGEPGNEAHGGYAYCSVAALAILGKLKDVKMGRLMDWISSRQMKVEGGFQGRTNKLVDGCYSLWQGCIPAILAEYANIRFQKEAESGSLIYDQLALQKYILLCCQQIEGGLRDKPGKPRDYYHTCYCVSGLSSAQHGAGLSPPLVLGDVTNLVGRISSVHNINLDKAKTATAYFRQKPCSHTFFMS